MTEKEIAEANLIPEGEYDIEITKAINDTSKSSGADMIKLIVKAFKNDGGFVLVNDYLVATFIPKIHNASKAFGVLDKYSDGLLDASDFEGKAGKARISIQKDDTGKYPDKNNIAKYILDEATTANDYAKASAGSSIDPELDDEIPFK